MNTEENELNGADQTASTEANAAGAADNIDMEIANSEEDTSEVDELIDYNEQEEIEAARKAAEQKALKEMLTTNGFTLRNILRTEKVKAHYTSPFSKEDAMSLEDILSEIPKEDLHEVGMVITKAYLYACIFCAEVGNSHNQSA